MAHPLAGKSIRKQVGLCTQSLHTLGVYPASVTLLSPQGVAISWSTVTGWEGRGPVMDRLEWGKPSLAHSNGQRPQEVPGRTGNPCLDLPGPLILSSSSFPQRNPVPCWAWREKYTKQKNMTSNLWKDCKGQKSSHLLTLTAGQTLLWKLDVD